MHESGLPMHIIGIFRFFRARLRGKNSLNKHSQYDLIGCVDSYARIDQRAMNERTTRAPPITQIVSYD